MTSSHCDFPKKETSIQRRRTNEKKKKKNSNIFFHLTLYFLSYIYLLTTERQLHFKGENGTKVYVQRDVSASQCILGIVLGIGLYGYRPQLVSQQSDNYLRQVICSVIHHQTNSNTPPESPAHPTNLPSDSKLHTMIQEASPKSPLRVVRWIQSLIDKGFVQIKGSICLFLVSAAMKSPIKPMVEHIEAVVSADLWTDLKEKPPEDWLKDRNGLSGTLFGTPTDDHIDMLVGKYFAGEIGKTSPTLVRFTRKPIQLPHSNLENLLQVKITQKAAKLLLNNRARSTVFRCLTSGIYMPESCAPGTESSKRVIKALLDG